MIALIEAAKAPDFPAEIALVISNIEGAGGLARAEAAGIATKVIPHQGLTREAFDANLDAALTAAGFVVENRAAVMVCDRGSLVPPKPVDGLVIARPDAEDTGSLRAAAAVPRATPRPISRRSCRPRTRKRP